jgi:hypothetical protein
MLGKVQELYIEKVEIYHFENQYIYILKIRNKVVRRTKLLKLNFID